MTKYVPNENGELAALDHLAALPQNSLPATDLGLAFAKMFLSLALLIALLLLSYWLVRKFVHGRLQRGGAGSSIQILEKRMLSPKTMLYLVEIENKKVLIAESQLEIKRIEGL